MAWEDCEGNIRRQEVPGGWIYKIPEPYLSVVFVPEPSKVTGSNRDAELLTGEIDPYKQGFEDGRVSAYDGDTPEGGPNKVTPLSPEQVKQHQSDLSQSYDKAYKDGWDAALMTFPHKLTPYENDLAIRDKLGKAYANGYKDGSWRAAGKVTPEQADKASDEAYDEAYTDGWRAAGGKVTVVEPDTVTRSGTHLRVLVHLHIDNAEGDITPAIRAHMVEAIATAIGKAKDEGTITPDEPDYVYLLGYDVEEVR